MPPRKKVIVSNFEAVSDTQVRHWKGKMNKNELIVSADPNLSGKIAKLAKKVAWTHKSVPMTVKGIVGRQLFSAVTTDRNLHKQGILFTDNSEHPVLNRTISEDLVVTKWQNEIIHLKGAAGQMVAATVDFKYPFVNPQDDGVINITRFFKENIVIHYGVAKSIIDDELYNIIKEFIKTFEVYYNPSTLAIGFAPRLSYNQGTKSLVDLLTKEVEQWYVNKIIGDKDRKNSYTHILRRNLKLNLQWWQRDLITNWKQYNFIAGSRRIGKSYLSAYIWYREFYRKGSGYGDRNRQVLYVTLNDKKAWQPFQYMLKMTEQDRKLGYITVNMWEKEFTCTITGTKLIFITAWARWGAASYGADLVIIDEAAMIPNDFWDDLLPIIVQEQASVFAISTINESAKQNWFYKYLLRWEMWNNEIQSIRVTIDDNELLWESEKEKMKDALVDNQLKYWTQLYSIFPTGSTVFQMNWTIKNIQEVAKRDLVVIWYDPARTNDNAAFVVFDPTTFEVVEEHIMKWESFKVQRETLMRIKERHFNSTVIMDRTGIWEWVYEIFEGLIDCSVKYKGSGEINLSPYWYWNVTKWELITTTAIFIQEYWLKISDQLENLIHEMKHFKVITNQGKIIQYGGIGSTDDSVNALALCIFFVKHISWVSSPIDFREKNNSISFDDTGMFYDFHITNPEDNQDMLYKKYLY